MSDPSMIFGFSVGGALLVIMTFGIVFSSLVPTSDKWSKRYFITVFSLLLLCSASCFVALLLWDDPRMAVAERIVYFFESLLLSSLMLLPTVFLLHCSGEKIKSSSLFQAVAALWSVYFLMLIATQFTNVFYYVTPNNQYYRGPLFALSLSPLVVAMLLNIAGVIRRRDKLSKRCFNALLVYLVPMTAAVFVHGFISVEIIVVLCMALFALIMFSLILLDSIEQTLLQQREIANQRTDILVLQMRPHFIYNTMMGIYYLCVTRTPKRQSRSRWISPPTCARIIPPSQARTPFPLRRSWNIPAPTLPLSRHSLKTACSSASTCRTPCSVCRP